MDVLVAVLLLPEHTQETALAAQVEHVQARTIGKGAGSRFNGDNTGAIHVNLVLYADAVCGKVDLMSDPG